MAYPKRSLLHADVNKKIGYVPGISVSSSRRIFTDNNLQQGSSQISFPYVGSFRANLPRDIPPDQRRHVAENIGTTRSCFVWRHQKLFSTVSWGARSTTRLNPLIQMNTWWYPQYCRVSSVVYRIEVWLLCLILKFEFCYLLTLETFEIFWFWL